MKRNERRKEVLSLIFLNEGMLAVNNKWQTKIDKSIKHMIKDGLLTVIRTGFQSKFKKFHNKKQTYIRITKKGIEWLQNHST